MPTISVVVTSALLLIAFLQPVKSMWSEMEVVSLNPLNTTDSKPLEYDIQIKRIRKGVYGVSGSVLMTDTYHKYMTEVIILHSPMRNNDYKLIPARIPKGSACDKVNNEYRKFLMKDLHKVSDFPYSDDPKVDMCDMFATGDKYTARLFEFDSKPLPKFLEPGYYKVITTFQNDGVVYGGLEVIVDLQR